MSSYISDYYSKIYFFLSSIKLEENMLYGKNQDISINIQTNATKLNIMILEKFEKKNHQIWSYYEGVIPITKFTSGLKRKRWIAYVFVIVEPCYKV